MLLFDIKEKTERKTKNKKQKIWNAILEDKGFRLEYFKADFFAFFLYYNQDELNFGVKEFHKDIFRFLETRKNGIIEGFRGSGKTAIVGLWYIIWLIANKKAEFIMFLAYEQGQASDKIMNIITILKTNKRLIYDYGYLFDDGESRKQDISKQQQIKRQNKFIATNGVKIQGESLHGFKRGQQFVNESGNIIRPNIIVADDINIKEANSNIQIIQENYYKITSDILNSLEGNFILLSNAYKQGDIKELLKENYALKQASWSYLNIPLIKNGVNQWQEKFPETEKEAEKLNQELYNGQKKLRSIEALKKDPITWKTDYLNISIGSENEYIFNHTELEKQNILDPRNILKLNIDSFSFDFKIYKDWDFTRYIYLSCGIDTAGKGGELMDSEGNTIERIDKKNDYYEFTFLDENGDLFGTISSQDIDYFIGFKILQELNKKYKINLLDNGLVIERNLYGQPLIEEIRRKDIQLARKIYRKRTDDKGKVVYVSQLGWWTDKVSKEKLIENLKRKLIYDKLDLTKEQLEQFKGFVRYENGTMGNDGIIAMHDDKVISYGLALQGLNLNY